MYRTVIFGVAAAMMLAGKVSAQSALPDGDNMSTGAVTSEAGLYGILSPGNRKIADALFKAQQTGDGSAAWTVEDIAKAKRQGTGWGSVFKRMKADGLVREKSLGQVVSGRGMTKPGAFKAVAAQTQPVRPLRYVRPVRSNVIVTTADGRRVVYGLSKPGHRAKLLAREKGGLATGSAEKTGAWTGAKAVKGHDVRTKARTSQPTVSLTARRAFVATGQSAQLGRIARGAGRKARKAK